MSADLDALNDLALRNRGVAVLIAKGARCRRPDVRRLEREDATQAAFLGLVQATRTYEPSRGKFTSWAKKYVLAALRRAAETAGVVRVPCCRAGEKGRYGRERGRAFGVAVGLRDDDRCGGRVRASRGEVDAGDAWAAAESLPGDLRAAVRLRHAEGLSFRDMGRRMGITHESARQIYGEAIRELRKVFGVEE